VGATVVRFPIEAGHIAQFARAIGDDNPVYTDEEYAHDTELGGIVAPPTFVQAVVHFDETYPHRPRRGQPWRGSGRGATGLSPGGGEPTPARMHAEQRFEYFAPLRPGDVLQVTTVPGDTWHKDGRSGRLIFEETVTEFRDRHGELAVRSRTVAVTVIPTSQETDGGE
jgi:acyl dehydratase